MDDLRNYIVENKELLEDEEIPQGDFERFEQRLSERRRIQFRRSTIGSRRTRPFWRVALIPAAAAIALVMIIRMTIIPILNNSPENQLSGAEACTAAEAYTEYIENVADISRSIVLLTVDMTEHEAERVINVVENISRENVPLIDLLPAELSEERKIHIINDYSKKQIEALMAYKTRLTNKKYK